MSPVILTTSGSLPNNQDYEIAELVTAECVMGMNVFRDIFAGVRDFFGGKSVASQKVLSDLKDECLQQLREEARALDADAVIGVDLDYSEFSGGGRSMLFLVASGTAVRTK